MSLVHMPITIVTLGAMRLTMPVKGPLRTSAKNKTLRQALALTAVQGRITLVSWRVNPGQGACWASPIWGYRPPRPRIALIVCLHRCASLAAISRGTADDIATLDEESELLSRDRRTHGRVEGKRRRVPRRAEFVVRYDRHQHV